MLAHLRSDAPSKGRPAAAVLSPRGGIGKAAQGIHTLVSQCAYLGLRPLTMSK